MATHTYVHTAEIQLLQCMHIKTTLLSDITIVNYQLVTCIHTYMHGQHGISYILWYSLVIIVYIRKIRTSMVVNVCTDIVDVPQLLPTAEDLTAED